MSNFNDIKLIVSDLDHTLLTEEGKLPEKFFNYYKTLKEKNIQFVVASGRPFHTIQETFKPILKDMIIISDNGALVTEKGKVIYNDLFSKENYTQIINFTLNNTNYVPILCRSGLGPSYISKRHLKYKEELSKYFSSLETYEDVCEINAPISKISIYFPEENSREAYTNIFKDRYSKEFIVVLSDSCFLDIMNLHVNKGEALNLLMDRYKINSQQVIAFGDSMNDKEMIEKAYYSFAVSNADPNLKRFAKNKTDSNDNFGVFKILDEII